MPEDPVSLHNQALAMCTALGGRLKGWSLFNPHSTEATEFYGWKGPQRCSHSIHFKDKATETREIS